MENSFDLRANTWDDDPRRVWLASRVFEAIERHVPIQAGFAALDYGCGTGLLTLFLAPRVRRVTAVDSSPGMLAVLAQKAEAAGIGNVSILQADFSNDSRPLAPCDLVVSSMTLHHVADVASLLRTFFRIMGAGAHLAIADLDSEDGSFHAHAPDIAHNGFDRAALALHFSAAGFENVQLHDAARFEKNNRPYSLFLAVARKPGESKPS